MEIRKADPPCLLWRADKGYNPPGGCLHYEVFIAFAGPDRVYAAELHRALLAAGKRSFMDAEVAPGQRWAEAILTALAEAPLVVVLVSAHTPDAHYQLDEIARVGARGTREHKRVVPVCLDKTALPYGLAPYQALPWQGVADLLHRLDLGAPPFRFVVGPPIRNNTGFVGRTKLCSTLMDRIDRGQGVQLLGERRMGKTSLLLWLQRNLPQARRKVAYVDLEGPLAARPREWVRDLARQLGADRVAQEVDRSRLSPAEALRELPPSVVLLDEVEALLDQLSAYDDGFFEGCRWLSQAGQVVWVTVSARELSALFAEKGRTSPFQNDAAPMVIGPLEAGGVAELVGAEQAGQVERLGQGQPMPTQAAAEFLFGGGAAEEICFDVVEAVKDQAFCRWWARSDRWEREALEGWKRGEEGSSEPLRAARRRMERRGIWPREGSAWAWWVRHG